MYLVQYEQLARAERAERERKLRRPGGRSSLQVIRSARRGRQP